MAVFDWLILIIYLAIIIIMAGWFARRQNSTEDFYLGGRSIPWWAVGFSFFGSSISTGTFLSFPGQGYGGNWIPHLAQLIFPFTTLLVAIWVVPYYRQNVKMSAYEFLEKRFGYATRCYASTIYVLFHLFRNGMILFLMGKALNAMTGWDPRAIVIISGVLAIFYTMFGGLEAVIWTDILQSITLFGGGLLCLYFLTIGSDGGFFHLFEVAHAADKFTLFNWSLNLSNPTVYVVILFGIFTHATFYTTSQDTAQRYLATPSTREAQKSLLWGGFTILITWTLFLLIGSLLYAYFQIHPDQLPPEIAAKETQVFPFYVMNVLPIGVSGLILAGMCAAAMSSLDTSINSMSMITVRDFYLHFYPQATDRQQLYLGQGTCLFWGTLGIAVGLLLLTGIEQAFSFGMTITSLLGGGIFGLFMLGMFVPRAHSRGIICGIASGILVSIWGGLDQILGVFNVSTNFINTVRFPWHPWIVLGLGNIISFSVGWSASLIISDPREKRIQSENALNK
jgi:SSS family solute:Na+ symporter